MSLEDGPTTREHELPSGELAVARRRLWEWEAWTVEADDRDLYALLSDVLADAHVPDLMPAHLATACEDLVDVRETVMGYDRGSVNLDGMAAYGMGYCHEVRDAIDEHRDDEPTTLVAAGCSSSKHEADGRLAAAHLYRGGFWTVKRRFAIETGDDWRILSAEHDVLHPGEWVEHYERTPDDLEGIPADSDERLPNGEPVATLLDQWALRVYEGLQAWINQQSSGTDPDDVELVFLLGRKYRDRLEARGVFEALRAPSELSIEHPFQRDEFDGNGDQMRWMNERVEEARGDDE